MREEVTALLENRNELLTITYFKIQELFDKKYGEILGAHFIGENVTEMIAEIIVARKLETTAMQIVQSIHPHPTMSEAIMEAAAAAYGEAIHL